MRLDLVEGLLCSLDLKGSAYRMLRITSLPDLSCACDISGSSEGASVPAEGADAMSVKANQYRYKQAVVMAGMTGDIWQLSKAEREPRPATIQITASKPQESRG
jgi:hypothetical protein